MQSSTRLFPFFVLAAFLFLTGGFLRTLAGGSAYLPNLFFVAGALVLALTLIVAARTLRLLVTRVREVAEPGPAGVWALLGAIACVLAAILGIEHVRYDLTERKIHELSPASREALAALSEDVEMIASFRDDHPLRPRVEAMLTAYATASGRIATQRIDPDREPSRARSAGLTTVNTITVRSQEFEEVVAEIREPAVTQAILRLADPERPVVAFTVDHGEVTSERVGWNKLTRRLVERGFAIRQLTSRDLTAIPPEVRVLVVAGPTSAFLPGEVEAVDRFLGRGGRLAAFLDPRLPTGLEPLLANQGILVDGRLLRDDSPLTRAVQLGAEAVAVSPEGLGDHEVTRGLPAGVVLRSAQQVGLAPRAVFGTSGADLLRSETLARQLGGEGGTEPGDPARRPLAAALEWEVTGELEAGVAAAEKPFARVVVVGDSDFLRDDMIDLFGNPVFVTRIFGWLGERTFLLQFPAFGPAGTPLEVGRNGLLAAFYVVQVALPLVAFGIGFILWARRR